MKVMFTEMKTEYEQKLNELGAEKDTVLQISEEIDFSCIRLAMQLSL